jgi:hypothetical protein
LVHAATKSWTNCACASELLNETMKVAINGGETDPRQPLVNPPVDLMCERVGVIALEGFEHLLQLTCCTFAGRFSVTASDKRSLALEQAGDYVARTTGLQT